MHIRILFLALLVSLCSSVVTADEKVDFETQVAPILSEHCVGCHSANISKGDLSLSTFDQIRDEGYVSPGSPEDSVLLDMITSAEGERPEMPKDAPPLAAAEVELIRKWIQQGAEWPDNFTLREKSRADGTWWSLQPVVHDHSEANIDEFVDAALQAKDLHRNPPAERRALIRRATYDLLGLPPSPQEIESFVADTRPDAYDRLIDRLLDSPHYGERWGRHWLDVVRFGESNGYERNVIVSNIWPFRDYVIQSINDDKPFDQFIREHIAGDVIDREAPDVAVGSAFLVAGPYDDVGNQDAVQAAQTRANTLDEIINATGQAFLGLTLGCARCHDHKFDPILQSDYYGFYATFAGVRHGSAELATPEERKSRREQLAPLEEQRKKLEAQISSLNELVFDRAMSKLDDYKAKWPRPPANRLGTEEQFEPTTARFVRLVCEARDTNIKQSTGFGIDEFEVWSTPQASADGDSPSNSSINVALASNGGRATGKTRNIEDFADAYSAELAIDGKTGARFIAGSNTLTIELAKPTEIDRVVFSSAKNALKPQQPKFSFVAEYRIEVSMDGEAWQEVANSHDRQPTDLASNPSHQEHRLAKLEITQSEKQQRGELQRELRDVRNQISAIPGLPSVFIGSRNENEAKGPFHVFLGGSPQKKGKTVSASSLEILQPHSGYELADAATEAQRRLALADWIASSDNPLTARVLANRVWQYHFGTGIVDTPSDFGYMGGRPTHPKLLDFLAAKLIEFEWQLKPLHRLIMRSQTYQQSADHRPEAANVDGDARLLWRFPPRRLGAEEIRDTLLTVAGKLQRHDQSKDSPDSGPGFRLYHFMQDNVCTYAPLDEHGPETYRRAVFHQNARASVVDLMTDFDQPDCAFSTPKRAETTTPLQALTMLNHRFTLDMAEAMAQRLEAEAGSETAAQIDAAYHLCFGRSPTEQESGDCEAFVRVRGMPALCRVLLNTSELIHVR